jgi:hypothetical protein
MIPKKRSNGNGDFKYNNITKAPKKIFQLCVGNRLVN